MRTEQEIVDQTNRVADLLSRQFLLGYVPGGKYHLSTALKAQTCWLVACQIQEMLTGTDPENAVAECAESAPDPSDLFADLA